MAALVVADPGPGQSPGPDPGPPSGYQSGPEHRPQPNPDRPLVVVLGPTGSGKSTLALRLAQQFGGEIVSCDSVAVYRGMDLGTAKPAAAERARVPHHLIDVADPDQAFTAGDYSRHARAVLTTLPGLPIVAGGTGLYLRALLDGLFPAPPIRSDLRDRLRTREAPGLHRILCRLDPSAAALIHPNDQPKLVRAIEVTLAGRKPMTQLWQAGRDPLRGFRILRLGLRPDRPALYRRIDHRAAQMFSAGLVEETRLLLQRFGPQRPFESLGYREASAVLRGEIALLKAIASAQQGHRNYAKRQGTWFRRDLSITWLDGFGDEDRVSTEAIAHVREHLAATSSDSPA